MSNDTRYMFVYECQPYKIHPKWKDINFLMNEYEWLTEADFDFVSNDIVFLSKKHEVADRDLDRLSTDQILYQRDGEMRKVRFASQDLVEVKDSNVIDDMYKHYKSNVKNGMDDEFSYKLAFKHFGKIGKVLPAPLEDIPQLSILPKDDLDKPTEDIPSEDWIEKMMDYITEKENGFYIAISERPKLREAITKFMTPAVQRTVDTSVVDEQTWKQRDYIWPSIYKKLEKKCEDMASQIKVRTWPAWYEEDNVLSYLFEEIRALYKEYALPSSWDRDSVIDGLIKELRQKYSTYMREENETIVWLRETLENLKTNDLDNNIL